MKFKVDMLTNGRIFNVQFVKKDGSVRSMNARLGVTKHLRSGQLKYNPTDKNYIIVFSMGDGGYRTISLEHVLRIKCNGNEYTRI